MYTFAKPPESSFFLTDDVGRNTAYHDVFQRFMLVQSQTPEEFSERIRSGSDPVGFKALRERPILNFSNKLSVILDPTIFTESIMAGALFRVVAARKEARRVFGAFGYAFEDYGNNLLQSMYPPGRGILVKRLVCNARGRTADGSEFEVDAILSDIKAVLIFEMKAVWVREDRILTADYNEFLSELRDNYGGASKGAERNKGVGQLAKIVGAVARREWQGDGNAYSDAAEIYPILTAYDERMGASGLGKFLDDEFQRLLGVVPPKITVHPLIVLTVGELENLTSSVEQFSLREFLGAYSRRHPDRMRSVHDFMARSEFAEKIRPSQIVRDESERFMDIVKAELFPPKPQEGSVSSQDIL
jgi:hypothetical protein